MKNALNSVKVEKPRNNAFDLTHDVKLSLNMGELVPVLAMECVPGDRVRISAEAIARFAPLISPMMHRCDLSIHYFFVPNRIVWPNWETWISGGSDQGEFPGTLPAHPYIDYARPGVGDAIAYTRLMDYLGLPDPIHAPGTNVVEQRVSAIPFAAYQAIYNEYYRDENLVSIVNYELNDGPNMTNGDLPVLRNRAWEADYFTKALPFAQKGQAVDIPLGEVPNIPVVINREPPPASQTIDTNLETLTLANVRDVTMPDMYAAGEGYELQATTINDLRLAYRLQEWLEKNARGGTRYSELIRSHFGVQPEDARLQRPEYITGIKSPVQISEVLNTNGEGLPQGNMAGHGVTYAKGNFGKYFCTEHGYIIGIMSIMPKTAYMQGIPKHFLKYTDPTQLFWPSFAHIGEQEIQNQEIWAFQSDVQNTATFGYTPRYMEYKNLPSRVAGDFKTTLDYWHMSRYFPTPPALNGNFVTADPTTRIFAVEDPDAQKMYCHIQNNIMAIRPMPVFGTPTF
ncbi:MAG: major capsid protein [Arizlama microvirus]|nr:MAG: major capsid protein [Arizlama microvirus]